MLFSFNASTGTFCAQITLFTADKRFVAISLALSSLPPACILAELSIMITVWSPETFSSMIYGPAIARLNRINTNNCIRNNGSRISLLNSSESLLRFSSRFRIKSSEGIFRSMVLGRNRYRMIRGIILASASNPSGLENSMLKNPANQIISREWSCK